MGERVRITDVSPRDGLQNEPGFVSTQDKARLVAHLCATGADEVEVSSFVSPKWIPQLGDAVELFGLVAPSKPASVSFSALVPNEQGMRTAMSATRRGEVRILDKVCLFTAASETFCRKNTNASIADSIERFVPVVQQARAERIAVRVYVSCAIACPFEGPTPPAKLQRVVRMLERLTPDEIDLSDTIGAGTPGTVTDMVKAAIGSDAWTEDLPRSAWVVHLHDTFGRAADCVRAALDLGVRSFDGSVAGLGGCPYASRPGRPAPGNIDTQLLVRAIQSAGYETGVDLGALARAAEFARAIVAEARVRAAAPPPDSGGAA